MTYNVKLLVTIIVSALSLLNKGIYNFLSSRYLLIKISRIRLNVLLKIEEFIY